jgi:acetolactate decarboxylase
MQGNRGLIIVLALIVVMSVSTFYVGWQLGFNSGAAIDREVLFQVASFNTFSTGRYEGHITFGELSKYGDFGIGTFEGLDGEMLALDGVFYKIPFDGKPVEAKSSWRTPYATITYFEADYSFTVSNISNYSELKAYIDGILPSENAIYAIKVSGIYDYAQTRSVPKQVEPYPTVTEAIQNQSVFELTNVSATAVGFWFPQSMDGVDFPGYHLHLITDDRAAGGHLLDCIIRDATIEIDQTKRYMLALS